MFQNIILITLIIILFFFLSNETKINDLISKKYIKYLFILIIIYFVYQNYNISLLVIILLVIIFFNVDIKNKFQNNKYLNNFESFKNLFVEYYNNFNEDKPIKKERFTNNQNEDYDIKHYKENKITEENKEIEGKNKIEPFKTEVMNLKDIYENIKLEIKKLSN